MHDTLRPTRAALVLTALALLAAPAASAQCDADRAAVGALIDQYEATEAAMDMRAQGALMSADRVHITAGGRMTDQAQNMEMQQAQYDFIRAAVPGMRQFVEARDRMVQFVGGCDAAVASFTWVITPVPGASTPPQALQMMEGFGGPPDPSSITLVLERTGGEWAIVHTHASALGG